jgi:hypothetical protein
MRLITKHAETMKVFGLRVAGETNTGFYSRRLTKQEVREIQNSIDLGYADPYGPYGEYSENYAGYPRLGAVYPID